MAIKYTQVRKNMNTFDNKIIAQKDGLTIRLKYVPCYTSFFLRTHNRWLYTMQPFGKCNRVFIGRGPNEIEPDELCANTTQVSLERGRRRDQVT